MSNLDRAEVRRACAARRVVTGHDSNGKSCIISDGPSPFWIGSPGTGPVVTDIWRCVSLPANNDGRAEACVRPIELAPPEGGNVFRLVYIPPDREYLPGLVQSRGGVNAAFSSLGTSGQASAFAAPSSPHPLMHRTDTVDYIVVISGELYAVLDLEETLLRPGDVLVQRGTNHAWSNRSDAPCLIAAVLNSAVPVSEVERWSAGAESSRR